MTPTAAPTPDARPPHDGRAVGVPTDPRQGCACHPGRYPHDAPLPDLPDGHWAARCVSCPWSDHAPDRNTAERLAKTHEKWAGCLTYLTPPARRVSAEPAQASLFDDDQGATG